MTNCLCVFQDHRAHIFCVSSAVLLILHCPGRERESVCVRGCDYVWQLILLESGRTKDKNKSAGTAGIYYTKGKSYLQLSTHLSICNIFSQPLK